MAVSAEFKDAVNSGNLIRVRVMLKNSMQSDLTLRDFEEKVKYAESNLPDLYDVHDGEMLNDDITTWSFDALDTQTARVVNNFSRERVDYIKKLVRHLYAKQVQVAEREAFVRDKRNTSTAKAVGAALVVGGGAAVAADLIAVSRAAAAAKAAAEAAALTGEVVVATGTAACHPALAIAGAVAIVGGVVIIARNK